MSIPSDLAVKHPGPQWDLHIMTSQCLSGGLGQGSVTE